MLYEVLAGLALGALMLFVIYRAPGKADDDLSWPERDVVASHDEDSGPAT